MQNNTEIILHTGGTIQPKRGDYFFTAPNGNAVQLKRDTHFGVPKIRSKDGSEKPALKTPILYKAGAEKLMIDYGVRAVYDLIDQISERGKDTAYFSYIFRCRLIKFVPALDRDMTIAEGYGSANTNEKNTGFASAFDVANAKLKIAKKRAMVDAVLSMTGLSGCFTQDMEDEAFMAKSDDIVKLGDDDPITRRQISRIFAICADAGIGKEAAKKRLNTFGFASTKDITQKDYDAVCDALRNGKEYPAHADRNQE